MKGTTYYLPLKGSFEFGLLPFISPKIHKRKRAITRISCTGNLWSQRYLPSRPSATTSTLLMSRASDSGLNPHNRMATSGRPYQALPTTEYLYSVRCYSKGSFVNSIGLVQCFLSD